MVILPAGRDDLSRMTVIGWYGAAGASITNPFATAKSCPICDAEDFDTE